MATILKRIKGFCPLTNSTEILHQSKRSVNTAVTNENFAPLFLKTSSDEALAMIVTSAEAYWDKRKTDNLITVFIFVTVGKSTSLQATSMLLSDRCRVQFSNQFRCVTRDISTRDVYKCFSTTALNSHLQNLQQNKYGAL